METRSQLLGFYRRRTDDDISSKLFDWLVREPRQYLALSQAPIVN